LLIPDAPFFSLPRIGQVYGVLPAAAAFTVVYSKMANVLSKVRRYTIV
jgi:ATP/ADP translocase